MKDWATDKHVCAAVTVTYGESGRMRASYNAGEGEPKGYGQVNGYNRPIAEAAAEAAVEAVEAWAEKTKRDLQAVAEWANVESAVVGRIGRNKFAVVFTGTTA